ncbi:MAG: hypothetical protein Q9181_003547 [Wetmoreana brouardii]
MERPSKRRRLFTSGNPDAELHERRTRNDMKLKSIFESIFEKYGKDFSDVGDEIDLKTGEIVRNNGHLENMIDERDPGIEDEHLSAESEHLSGERQSRSVIPDSQDYESSDDDPLGTMEDVISTAASRLNQSSADPLFQNTKGRSFRREPRVAISPTPKQHATLSSLKRQAVRGTDNDTPVEEAWRVPALAEDCDPKPALPSPDPSDQEDSDSSRSASPPGVSLWALPRSRGPSNSGSSRNQEAIGTPDPIWTKEEDRLLKHFKTSATSKYSDFRHHFPGRTIKSLQRRWKTLGQIVHSASANTHANLWTQEEDQLLRQLKSSTAKTFPEIQQELPGRSIAAISLHWYRLRQRIAQSPSRRGSPSSDSSDLPSPSRLLEEYACSQQLSSLQNAQSKHSDALVQPFRPNCDEAETAELLASSDKGEPYDIGPPSPRPKRRNFPSGTIIADSQGVVETQGLLDLALEPDSSRTLEDSLTDQVLPSASVIQVQDRVVNATPSHEEVSHQPRPLQRAALDPLPLQSDEQYLPSVADLTTAREANSSEQSGRPMADPDEEYVPDDFELPIMSAPRDEYSPSMDTPSTDFISGSRRLAERLLADVLGVTELTYPKERWNNPVLPTEGSEESADASRLGRTGTQDPGRVTEGPTTPPMGGTLVEKRDSRQGSLNPNNITEKPSNAVSPPTEVKASPPGVFACPTGATIKHFTESTRASAQVFKQIEISRPSYGSPVTSLITPRTPESCSRRIKPFELVLPTRDKLLTEKRKHLTGKARLAQEKTSVVQPQQQPRHVQQDVLNLPTESTVRDTPTEHLATESPGAPQALTDPSGDQAEVPDMLKENGSAGPGRESDPTSRAGHKRKRSLTPTAGDDEDDLQLSLKPATAAPLRNDRCQSGTGSVYRLAFRPRIEDNDISDDELSTSTRVVQVQAEMTPVRPLMVAKRSLNPPS